LPQKSAGGRYAKDTDRVYLAERLLHDPKIDDVVIAFGFAGLEVDRAGRREVADGGANGSRPVRGAVTEEILMRLGLLYAELVQAPSIAREIGGLLSSAVLSACALLGSTIRPVLVWTNTP
jgi:hypothetical protein